MGIQETKLPLKLSGMGLSNLEHHFSQRFGSYQATYLP